MAVRPATYTDGNEIFKIRKCIVVFNKFISFILTICGHEKLGLKQMDIGVSVIFFFDAWQLIQSTVRKKRWRLYILPQSLANQTKPTGRMERYGLMAIVRTLTALLLSSLNELQFFFVLLYALLEFSFAKSYG